MLKDDDVLPFEKWDQLKQTVKTTAIERASELKFYAQALKRKVQNNLEELRRRKCLVPGSRARDIASSK